MAGEVGELLTAVENQKCTPTQVGKLLLEWQVLCKRQEGHGDFRRLFHQKEDEAREQLMSRMNTALFNFVRSESSLHMGTTASEIEYVVACRLDRLDISKAVFDLEGSSRGRILESFGIDTVKDADNTEVVENRTSMKDDAKLLSDISDSKENISKSETHIENPSINKSAPNV